MGLFQKISNKVIGKIHKKEKINGTISTEVVDNIKSMKNIGSKLNNYIYNNTTTHPLINQMNIDLLKFLTITNSIILSCDEFYYCKTNMVSLIRLKLYESFVKILTKYILPNNIKPIRCFDLAKIDNININDMYYNPALMTFFKVFTRNIVKYHSLKISQCLQDEKASQMERLTFVFNQFINGFYMIVEQLNGLSISCKDLIKNQSEDCKANLVSIDCKSVVSRYIRIYLSDIINIYNAITKDVIAALKLLIPDNILIILDFNLLSLPTDESGKKIDSTNNNGHKIAIKNYPNILSIIETAKIIGKEVYVINHQHIDLQNIISDQNCLNTEEELYALIYLWKNNNFDNVPTMNHISNNIDKVNIYKLNNDLEKVKYAMQQLQI